MPKFIRTPANLEDYLSIAEHQGDKGILQRNPFDIAGVPQSELTQEAATKDNATYGPQRMRLPFQIMHIAGHYSELWNEAITENNHRDGIPDYLPPQSNATN